jgi:serine O-acetyltransferase
VLFLFIKMTEEIMIPRRGEVNRFIELITTSLFPILEEGLDEVQEKNIEDAYKQLDEILERIYSKNAVAKGICNQFKTDTKNIYELALLDAKAILEGDPAASSIDEVIICYPGFYAILLHRIAHSLWKHKLRTFPRMIAELAHSKTGIDIHPGASIGKHFCIDHGTGIVIGESAVIGEHVKIYQGVTLGALSVSKDKAGKKRHPSIGNHVCIYSRTTILGGETIIGDHAIIGGNVWLTHSVAPHTMVLNKSETTLKVDRKQSIDYVI